MNDFNEAAIRLQCLQIAIERARCFNVASDQDVIALAERLYAFVAAGNPTPAVAQ